MWDTGPALALIFARFKLQCTGFASACRQNPNVRSWWEKALPLRVSPGLRAEALVCALRVSEGKWKCVLVRSPEGQRCSPCATVCQSEGSRGETYGGACPSQGWTAQASGSWKCLGVQCVSLCVLVVHLAGPGLGSPCLGSGH